MTYQMDFALMRTAIDNETRAEDVRRRSSGLVYWLMLPFAGFLIWGSAAWTAMALIEPPNGFQHQARRRLRGLH